MATIRKLKVGQIVYDKHQYKAGNTKMKRWGVYPVVIKEIDPDFRWVIATWNGNPARKYFESSVKQWKVKEPII